MLPQLTVMDGKSWLEFFICSPHQKVPPENGYSWPPDQADYLQLVEHWNASEPTGEFCLTVGIILGLLLLGMALATIVSIIVLRIRRSRKRAARRAAGLDSSTTTNTKTSQQSNRSKSTSESSSKTISF